MIRTPLFSQSSTPSLPTIDEHKQSLLDHGMKPADRWARQDKLTSVSPACGYSLDHNAVRPRQFLTAPPDMREQDNETLCNCVRLLTKALASVLDQEQGAQEHL